MPEGEIYIERRRHKRVEKRLKAYYRLITRNELDNDEELKKFKVESIDISTGGIQLICEENIETDNIIRIDIEIPTEKTFIETFAEVRWCRFDDKIKKYKIGLHFLVIKEDHINLINRLIKG
ncbi:MAG: PilZ domain-containing protein [Candidatus Goldbacteria bacterium]|nr:PilZ domain-containing protein [Candidatus Goldiibacteriota bacterium]